MPIRRFVDVPLDPDAILARFNRLMQDLAAGTYSRNAFLPWEIDLLLDIQSCGTRCCGTELLRRYQKAVQRELQNGSDRPLKLSEYLTRCRSRRAELRSEQVHAE